VTLQVVGDSIEQFVRWMAVQPVSSAAVTAKEG